MAARLTELDSENQIFEVSRNWGAEYSVIFGAVGLRVDYRADALTSIQKQ